jgi:hypothetical protein
MAQHTKLFCVLFSALVTSIPLLGLATPVFAGPIVTPSGNPCLPLSEARTADGLLLSTGTPCPSVSPTPTPTACEELWLLEAIATFGKSQSKTNNAKVVNFITGNIVDQDSLGDTAHRIPVCSRTPVLITVSDTTGVPSVTANSAGISCSGATCSVAGITETEKYIARSSDGKDKDRITLLPQ